MRTKGYTSFVVLLFVSCFLVTVPVHASNNDSTAIEVKIKERNLQIGKVQAPSFGKHYLSKRQNSYQAMEDLIIQIIDKRENQSEPWQVYYQLSDFYSQKEESFAAQLSIGKGRLAKQTSEFNAKFQALEVKTEGAKQKLLEIKGNTSKRESVYEYSVPKKNIYLTIPATVKAGEYQAVQTITLQNVLQQK